MAPRRPLRRWCSTPLPLLLSSIVLSSPTVPPRRCPTVPHSSLAWTSLRRQHQPPSETTKAHARGEGEQEGTKGEKPERAQRGGHLPRGTPPARIRPGPARSPLLSSPLLGALRRVRLRLRLATAVCVLVQVSLLPLGPIVIAAGRRLRLQPPSRHALSCTACAPLQLQPAGLLSEPSKATRIKSRCAQLRAIWIACDVALSSRDLGRAADDRYAALSAECVERSCATRRRLRRGTSIAPAVDRERMPCSGLNQSVGEDGVTRPLSWMLEHQLLRI